MAVIRCCASCEVCVLELDCRAPFRDPAGLADGSREWGSGGAPPVLPPVLRAQYGGSRSVSPLLAPSARPPHPSTRFSPPGPMDSCGPFDWGPSDGSRLRIGSFLSRLFRG